MFLKNIIAYSGSNILIQIALFAQGIVLRMILLPEVMGFWNFVRVVHGYINPVSLGLLSGAARYLPILHGQKKQDKEEQYRSVSLLFSMLEAVVVALCVMVYAYVYWDAYRPEEAVSLVVAGLLVIGARYRESYVVILQGAQAFIPLSKVLAVNNIIFAVFLPVGTYLAGIWGLFASAVISEIVRGYLITSTSFSAGIRAFYRWNRDAWKKLASYGIRMKVTDYPMTIFMTLDILWVTWFLSIGELAIYALAKSFATQASDISGRVSTVFYNHMLKKRGMQQNMEIIGEQMKNFIISQIFIVVPLVCWAVITIVPYLINRVIPAYSEAISTLIILTVGNFFLSQNNQLYSIWHMENRLLPYGISNLFGVVVLFMSLAFCWYFLNLKTLEGVAMATLFSYMVYFLYMIIVVGRDLWPIATTGKITAGVFIAAGWTMFILIFGGRMVQENLHWQNDLYAMITWMLISSAMILPLAGFGLWAGQGWKLLKTTFYGYQNT